MRHAPNVLTMTQSEMSVVSCGCCKVGFNPTPPYTKTDSYAAVVLQQSALSVKRKMQQVGHMAPTCARTHALYLYVRDIYAYLDNRAWLWVFRRLHYMACAKLCDFQTELHDPPDNSFRYRCVCTVASQQLCNDKYAQLFKGLLLQYTDGTGFQTQLFNLLSTRMCQDVASEVMGYMFHPAQIDMTRLYQRGKCL